MEERSEGFGFLIAKTLLKDGHAVAAAMRGADGKNKSAAEELGKAGAVPVEMDVTIDASVQKGVELAAERLGGLDVAVNNAGVGVLGLQECFSVEDWKKVFEVNLFGVQRVNRAVLPHFRKQNSGLLIHISSILGRMVIPFYGPYNATKFALEAMADNYRVELSPLGIESVIVEPGGYGTGFIDGLIRPSDAARNAEYGPMAQAPEASLAAFEKNLQGPNAPNPQWVADAVSELIKKPRGQRPFRTAVDRLGMGAAVEPYNRAAEELQKNVYGAFGMAGLLKLKV
jgi:NAD(P)-dependent dehydrogenase (short-subunit alcohol dehydrogenase family)